MWFCELFFSLEGRCASLWFSVTRCLWGSLGLYVTACDYGSSLSLWVIARVFLILMGCIVKLGSVGFCLVFSLFLFFVSYSSHETT